ncbi:Mis12 protein-domain-containing protein [Flammula alnicola]|nr:Mis12 protein-domain-containing protein [Flammula alnicola]
MPPASENPPRPVTTIQNAPPLLLCEALGFSPQLLLDDIINIANNAVQDGVNGMEEFLNKWADERVAHGKATTHEVEQGLVAFQTLLEYHTDIAFDFFEAWCLRNIFMIPQDLPVVLPHQEEQEQEAMDEQRKLNRYLKRAIKTSSRQLSQAETRLSNLSSLSSPDGSALDILHDLPPKFLEMYKTISSLPPLDISPSVDLTEPGKRQWETNKTGYMNWALGRLLVKGEVGEGVGHGAVDKVDRAAAEIGTGEELRRALDAVGTVKRELDAVEGRRGSEDQEDDSRMEE